MSSFFGATPTVDAEFDTFAAPLDNAPVPRWKRKALESKTKTPTKTTPGKSGKKKTPSGDRFIPNRSAMDLDYCRLALSFDAGKENGDANAANRSPTRCAGNSEVSPASPGSKASRLAGYNSTLASTLLDADPVTAAAAANSGSLVCDLPGSKILSFKNKAPQPALGHQNPNKVLYVGHNASAAPIRRKMFRHIPQHPEKILDAPALQEDFYLNLLDWGSSNVLAVALGETVYLWNASTGSIEQLYETADPDDSITSVNWLPESNMLAIGTNRAEVQIWDCEKMSRTRTMRSHSARVGALAWNGAILSSGSRDSFIHNHDTRIRQHHIATLGAHTEEVCGLKWSPNGTQLASGGNDNTVAIWDNQTASEWIPKFKFEHHTAAVKALAWCPWQSGLLATGGGTADRHLRFWNTNSGACVNSVDTGSQVCSVLWSVHEKELVTSHGFSQNQLTVWKYPKLERMAELKGHTSRVLHMSLSPDGQTVVSGAADETLRFWKVFAKNEAAKASRGTPGIKVGGLSSSSRSRGINIR